MGSSGPTTPAEGGRESRKEEEDERVRRDRRDDEYGRRGRRRDDDDDYDRDKRRGRRNDGDEDRYDRRRHRNDDLDDDRDEYERRPRRDPRAIEGQFNRASVACLLCFIGGWLQVGAIAVVVFVTILGWAEIQEGLNVFRIVAMLVGLGNLLTAAVGYGFLVSGPRDRGALGLSIATAAVAAFHLLLVLVIGTTSFLRDEAYAGLNWRTFVSEVPRIPTVLFALIGAPAGARIDARVILPVFACLAEVAKVILFLLTLRAIMGIARETRRTKQCIQAVLANAIGFGVMVALAILFGLLAVAVRNERGGWSAVYSVFVLALMMVQAGLVVWTTMVTKGVKEGIDYRPD
jgi:hypothetical protein